MMRERRGELVGSDLPNEMRKRCFYIGRLLPSEDDTGNPTNASCILFESILTEGEEGEEKYRADRNSPPDEIGPAENICGDKEHWELIDPREIAVNVGPSCPWT